jgi:hypothetical protein
MVPVYPSFNDQEQKNTPRRALQFAAMSKSEMESSRGNDSSIKCGVILCFLYSTQQQIKKSFSLLLSLSKMNVFE